MKNYQTQVVLGELQRCKIGQNHRVVVILIQNEQSNQLTHQAIIKLGKIKKNI